ncbi:Proteasome subunit beta [Labeo rohita]|uniref:Proteasome subunit beta n=1 Tax=Labeo rohita TaxID=84645 RepID=A0ABQ8L987_LABRO|nr:Proteasome subunit beta [Labeo rohita]
MSDARTRTRLYCTVEYAKSRDEIISLETGTRYISCLSTAAEVHILSLLETIKQQQDQLVAKVNYLSSRLNSTPGPDVEMPNNIHFPLENLEAVEAFEMFLKEPSNGPARQKVISSLATIGGQDVKRVTWNILGRLFTDEVSHQINWKGVNNKKPFSRMATKTLLFSNLLLALKMALTMGALLESGDTNFRHNLR